MKMRLLTLYLKELMAFTVLLLAVPAMSQETTKPDLRVITFGAGPIDGAYYEVVNEICTRFNHNPIEGYRCSTDPTPGSLYNLAALRRGTLDFALAQSDLHRALYRMSNYEASASKPFELRSVMSVYPEHFTILVRKDADIFSLADLRGQRVDQGPSNSGRRPTVERVFSELGLEYADFAELTQNTTLVALDELCAGRLDAVLLVIGHPNSAVAGALKDCDVRLVKASGTHIRKFVADNAEFTSSMILGGAYSELTENIDTFSVMATVMTRNDVSNELVAKMASIIMSLLKQRDQTTFSKVPSANRDRWTVGLAIPLHPAISDVFDLKGLEPKLLPKQ